MEEEEDFSSKSTILTTANTASTANVISQPQKTQQEQQEQQKNAQIETMMRDIQSLSEECIALRLGNDILVQQKKEISEMYEEEIQ